MQKISKDGHRVMRYGKGTEDGFFTCLFTYGVYSKNDKEVKDIKRITKYVKEVYPDDILGIMELYTGKKIIVGKRG